MVVRKAAVPKVLSRSGSSERASTRGCETKRTSRKRGPVERQYVAIDLHRRRSVIVRMTEEGEKLSTVKIANDPIALSLAIAEAGADPEVPLGHADPSRGGNTQRAQRP